MHPTDAALAWVDALNSPQDPSLLPPAFHPDATVYRYGVFEQAGQLVETFHGYDALAVWLARSPEGIRFWLDSPVTPDPDAPSPHAHTVRYAYGFGEWLHHGTWRFNTAPDGRILALNHLPDLLDDRIDAIDWTPIIEEARRKILGDREV